MMKQGSLSLSHLSLPYTGTCRTDTTFFLCFFLDFFFAWSTQHGNSMHSEHAAHVVLLFLHLLVKTAWPKHALAERYLIGVSFFRFLLTICFTMS